MPPEVRAAADAIAWAAGRLGDALPVLLGGAGGVLLVWWLDGRRTSRRDQRRLIGAIELVTLELAANVANADEWGRIGESGRKVLADGPFPIQLRSEAWTQLAPELAHQLPRDLIGRLGAAYLVMGRLEHNAAVAKQRGHIDTETVAIARRARGMLQASLRELQAYEQSKLGVRYTSEPRAPWELEDAAGGAESQVHD